MALKGGRFRYFDFVMAAFVTCIWTGFAALLLAFMAAVVGLAGAEGL